MDQSCQQAGKIKMLDSGSGSGSVEIQRRKDNKKRAQ